MKKTLILLCVWFCFFTLLFAEKTTPIDSKKSINQSTLVGIGRVSLHDSYLSPITYEGVAISLMHERIRGSNMFDGKLLLQNQFRIQTGVTDNPSASGSEYWGNLYYNLNGFYPIFETDKLRLFGGGGIDAALGGIYNVRNSNNPGSLNTYINLNIALMAIYNWRNLSFRWQVASPFVGAFFSPEYFGHSFYEIFTLGNNKGTVHFGSFQNQIALRNYFTVDIPIYNLTLRTGYMWDYYSTDVNRLVTKINAHQFMIGLAFESLNFGGRKARTENMVESVFY